MTILFMGLPTEALYMEAVSGQAGGLGRTADVVGPWLRPAYVDIPLGDVRRPGGQRGQVAGRADAVPEPGIRSPPVPRQPDDLESPLVGERLQFPPEQRVAARVPVQQDGVARRVLEFLSERPQRRDADAGSDERHLGSGAGPGGQPSVGAFDEYTGARPQQPQRGAAVADDLDGDPQTASVRSGRQRVGMPPGPAGTGH